jgi:hypothetical protein
MEMVLIKIGSDEWNYMWNWLKTHPLNSDQEDPYTAMHPETKECWQYMGSYKNGNRVLHELRHRNHPLTNKVEKLSVNASNEFNDDNIEKTLKMK